MTGFCFGGASQVTAIHNEKCFRFSPKVYNIFWGFGLLIKKQVSLINEVDEFHNLLPVIR
jgi:hypothetical protein